MTPLALKVAATVGIPAGVGIALIEAAAGVGLTGSPIVDGLLGGAGVTLITVGIYKQKVDNLTRAMDGKADKDTMQHALDRIDRHLEKLTDHILHK